MSVAVMSEPYAQNCAWSSAKMRNALRMAVRDDAPMSDIRKQLEYVRSLMDRFGLSSSELARKAGLSPSTLNRPLREGEDYAYEISNRTIRKLETWSRVPYAGQPTDEDIKEAVQRHGNAAEQPTLDRNMMALALAATLDQFRAKGSLEKVSGTDFAREALRTYDVFSATVADLTRDR